MQRKLLKTILLLTAIVVFLPVEAVVSEAIANTERKEEIPTTTTTNHTTNDDIYSKDTTRRTIHKRRNDSKVEGDRLNKFFQFVNSHNLQPTRNKHFRSEVKQLRTNSLGDNKLKNMLMTSLSNVKNFPKKLFDSKKQKPRNGRPFLNSATSVNSELVIPKQHSGVQTYKINSNDGEQISTRAPPQEHSVHGHSGNFVNQQHFRVSQDKSKDDGTDTNSGVRAFHFQNIGDTKNLILTPVFDHTVPVTLITHFEPGNLFAFQDPEFHDHSSSAESNSKSSQEHKDFKELNHQIFEEPRFITYDTLHKHGLLSSSESDSTSVRNLTSSEGSNFNPPSISTGNKHPDHQFINGFTDFNEQRHESGNSDNTGLVFQMPGHEDPDYHIYADIASLSNPNLVSESSFGHSTSRFTDSSATPVHGSTSFKESTKSPIQLEYLHNRPDKNEFSTVVDIKSHHSEHRPIYNSRNGNTHHIMASQDLVDNYDLIYNLQNHNMNSFSKPNINQIHIYKFLKPSSSHELNEATSFRIFQGSDENSDINYFSELSDPNSVSDPELLSSKEYHHLKSTSDTFIEPSEIELLPFGLEDRMPDNKFKNHGSNNLEGHIHSISSFVPSKGARGASKIESILNHHSGERSNTKDTSRFHGHGGNKNGNTDNGSVEFQKFPHSQYSDGTKLKGEGYSFTRSDNDFYSNMNNNRNQDIGKSGTHIIEPLTITEYEKTYENHKRNHKTVSNDYTHPKNSFNDDNFKFNVENEESKFRNIQSTNEKMKPLCYALPASYIPYPPYTKSQLICA